MKFDDLLGFAFDFRLTAWKWHTCFIESSSHLSIFMQSSQSSLWAFFQYCEKMFVAWCCSICCIWVLHKGHSTLVAQGESLHNVSCQTNYPLVELLKPINFRFLPSYVNSGSIKMPDPAKPITSLPHINAGMAWRPCACHFLSKCVRTCPMVWQLFAPIAAKKIPQNPIHWQYQI